MKSWPCEDCPDDNEGFDRCRTCGKQLFFCSDCSHRFEEDELTPDGHGGTDLICEDCKFERETREDDRF